MKRAQFGGGEVLLCGLCMDARGLADDELLASARRSSMDEFVEAALQAGKILVLLRKVNAVWAAANGDRCGRAK